MGLLMHLLGWGVTSPGVASEDIPSLCPATCRT